MHPIEFVCILNTHSEHDSDISETKLFQPEAWYGHLIHVMDTRELVTSKMKVSH